MTDTPKKNSSLKTRLITAFTLIPLLIAVLAIGGWFAMIAAAACLGIALYEELSTLKSGGYRPVWWPAFAALGIGIALILLHKTTLILPSMVALMFAVQLCVMRREDPQITDIVFSILPLLTVAAPGLCLIGLLDTQPRALQLMLLLFAFATSIGCDTMAYFAGTIIGGPKLCPHISPKKTIAGAVGGLFGSVLFALLVDLGFRWLVPDFTSGMPLYWTIGLGLVCGVVAQMGDLFASMLKRHCKVKDFGHIFPGHGGMMDRLDSILFTSIIVYCYRAILLGLI
ncbi:MAG: phosphatidate cytidylyltransferase [Clostridia bacterium]|nr:phosphatidate cytidylyltransferase [Clostridia bacterium]